MGECAHGLCAITQRSRLAVEAHVALLRERLDAVRQQVDALEEAGRKAAVPPAPAEEPNADE